MHDLHTLQAYFEMIAILSPNSLDTRIEEFWSSFSHKGGIA